jgi:hypothetical protein
VAERKVIMAEDLKYGSTYRIQNGYEGTKEKWKENYLDTRGQGCEGNLLCVSTSTDKNRASDSGTWKILSATKKAEGEPVLSGDQVYLQNQHGGPGAGGYLDTRGTKCEGNSLCVSTATSNNRVPGSGTWRIIKEDSGGNVQEDDVVHLWNGWSDWGGGFLDTRGAGCEKNLYCVSTNASWDREKGSTHWRFQKQ